MTEPDKTLVDANANTRKYANSFFFIPISPLKSLWKLFYYIGQHSKRNFCRNWIFWETISVVLALVVIALAGIRLIMKIVDTFISTMDTQFSTYIRELRATWNALLFGFTNLLMLFRLLSGAVTQAGGYNSLTIVWFYHLTEQISSVWDRLIILWVHPGIM